MRSLFFIFLHMRVCNKSEILSWTVSMCFLILLLRIVTYSHSSQLTILIVVCFRSCYRLLIIRAKYYPWASCLHFLLQLKCLNVILHGISFLYCYICEFEKNTKGNIKMHMLTIHVWTSKDLTIYQYQNYS